MRATAVALAAALPLVSAPSFADSRVRVGVGISVGQPQQPGYYGGYGRPYGYGRRYAETYRHGYDRGFHEGGKDGFKDGEKGRRFELYREGDYRDADKGYERWMGPRPEYARGYQRGYEEAYRRAFREGRERRYGRYRYERHDDDYDRRW